MSSSNRLEKLRQAKVKQSSNSVQEIINNLQNLQQFCMDVKELATELRLSDEKEKHTKLVALEKRLGEQKNTASSSTNASSATSTTNTGLFTSTVDEIINIGTRFKEEFSVIQAHIIGNLINEYDNSESLPSDEIAIKKAICQKILCYLQLRTEILIADERAYSIHGNRSAKLIRKLFKTFSYIPEDSFLITVIADDLWNQFQAFKNADQTPATVLEDSFSYLSADKKALINNSLTRVRQNVIRYSENFFEFEESITELCEKNAVSKEVYLDWQRDILLKLANQWMNEAADPKYSAIIRAQAKFEKAIIEKTLAIKNISLEIDFKSIKQEIQNQFSEQEVNEIQYANTSLSEAKQTVEATPEAINAAVEARIAALASTQKKQEKKKTPSPQALLQAAIAKADLPKIKQSIDAITFEELLIAAKHGHDNVLALLFKNRKFMEMLNNSNPGENLLSIAAKHNQIDVVKLILRQTKLSVPTLELALVHTNTMPEKIRLLIVTKYEKLSHSAFSDIVLQQIITKHAAPKETIKPANLVTSEEITAVAEPVHQTSSVVDTNTVIFEAKKSPTQAHSFFAAIAHKEETEDQINRITKLVTYLDFDASPCPPVLQFYLYKMQANALLFEMIQYFDIQSHLQREITQGLYRHTAALMRTALVHNHGLIKRNPDMNELRLLHGEVVEFAKAFISYVKDKNYDNFVKNPFYLKAKTHGKQLAAERKQNKLENISGEMRIHYSLSAGTDVMRFMKLQSDTHLALPEGLADSAIRMSNITGSVYGLPNAGFNRKAAIKDRHIAVVAADDRNSWRRRLS